MVEKRQKREVHVYDGKTGEYVCTYNSAREASRQIGVSTHSSILQACREGYKVNGNYVSLVKSHNYKNVDVKNSSITTSHLSPDELQVLNKYREIKNVAYGKKEEEGTNLVLTTNVARSLEDLIKEFDVDTGIWEAHQFKPGSWTTPVKAKFKVESKNEETINATIPLLIENRKSEVKFEKRTSIIDYDRFRRELVEDVKKKSPKVRRREYKKTNKGRLLEITIPDLHLGKLAWGEETGGENYDIKIAVDSFKQAIIDMCERAFSHDNISNILFVVGSDLFNSDTAYPYTQTTAGTPQQDDVRWQKVFRKGRDMVIETIEYLTQVAPVEVLVVPGNHDFQKSFYLGEVLEARFFNNENVKVDNSPRTRKYYRWGECLLGFAHGNRKDEGEDRLLSLMQDETKGDWAETKYREWHCGDIHHYKEVERKPKPKPDYRYAEDVNGVVVKYLRTLMFNDEWEARKGYRSQKGAHCFVWDKEQGNIVEYKYNK